MANDTQADNHPVTAADIIEVFGDRLLDSRAVFAIRELGDRLETCRQVMKIADIAEEAHFDSFSLFLDEDDGAYDGSRVAGGLGVCLHGWGGARVSVTADNLDIDIDDGSEKPAGWIGSAAAWNAMLDDVLEQVGELFRSEVTASEGQEIVERCGERVFPAAVDARTVMRAVLDAETVAELDARRLGQGEAKRRIRRRG